MPLTRRNVLLIAGLILIIGFAVLLATRSRNDSVNRNAGTVHILLQLADTSNMTTTLNSKAFNLRDVDTTHTLAPGNYTLSINKLGYKKFSAQFSIATGNLVDVNAIFTRVTTPVLDGLPSTAPPNWTITDTTYFYDNTWAFVNAQTTEGIVAFYIINFSDVTQRWNIVFGPGTIYPQVDTLNLPKGVRDYLFKNNYTYNNVEP